MPPRPLLRRALRRRVSRVLAAVRGSSLSGARASACIVRPTRLPGARGTGESFSHACARSCRSSPPCCTSCRLLCDEALDVRCRRRTGGQGRAARDPAPDRRCCSRVMSPKPSNDCAIAWCCCTGTVARVLDRALGAARASLSPGARVPGGAPPPRPEACCDEPCFSKPCCWSSRSRVGPLLRGVRGVEACSTRRRPGSQGPAAEHPRSSRHARARRGFLLCG